MSSESDRSMLLLENVWGRRFWEVHNTSVRWLVFGSDS